MKRFLKCMRLGAGLCTALLFVSCVTEIAEEPPAQRAGLTIDWVSWPQEDLSLRDDTGVLGLIADAKRTIQAYIDTSPLAGPLVLQIHLRPDEAPRYQLPAVAAASEKWIAGCEEQLHRGKDIRAKEKPQTILVRMTMRFR